MTTSRKFVTLDCSDVETYPGAGSHSQGCVVRSRRTVEGKYPSWTRFSKANFGRCFGSGFGIGSKSQSLLHYLPLPS